MSLLKYQKSGFEKTYTEFQIMLRYYFFSSLKQLNSNRFLSSMIIMGLGVALCVTVLSWVYVNDELSYERWLPNHENIYRLHVSANNSIRYDRVPSDAGIWLRNDYPEISEVTRLYAEVEVVRQGEQEFTETVYWSDSNLFDVFKFPLLEGSLESALEDADSIVIDEEIARKYFPSGGAIGQYLEIASKQNMRVTAVIESLPSNTHLDAKIFAAGQSVISGLYDQDQNPIRGQFGQKAWSTLTYAVIEEHLVSPVKNDLQAILDRHLPEADGRRNSEAYQLELMPIAQIHLSSRNFNQAEPELTGIYVVIAISLLVVFAASTNFVNLSISRGITRAPEIATRKVIGASRRNIFVQILIESFLYVFIAAVIAMISAWGLLPVLNGLLMRNIEFDLLNNVFLFFGMLLFILVTATISGIYPALVLSSYSPASLFTHSSISNKSRLFQSILSIIQYAIVTALLISVIVFYQQSRFGMQEGLRGLDDPIVVISAPCTEPLQSALIEVPFVDSVACSLHIPQQYMGVSTVMFLTQDVYAGVSYTSLDPHYLDMYELDVVAGRNFDRDRPGDASPSNNIWTSPESVVVNESTVAALGFDSPQQAIGQLVTWRHIYRYPGTFTEFHEAEIIGVVEDFQIGSIENSIPNAAFYYDPAQLQEVHIRIKSAYVSEALADIDVAWRELNNNNPMQLRFLDQIVSELYRDLTRQSKLILAFAVSAICVSLLGLLSLVTFIAAKRTKEIGIRKVLGGSQIDIILMLLWKFSKPLLLSNLLAWPISYYVLNMWLAGFASHIDLEIFVFILASLATFVIAVLVVASQIYVVSSTNPVRYLKAE